MLLVTYLIELHVHIIIRYNFLHFKDTVVLHIF